MKEDDVGWYPGKNKPRGIIDLLHPSETVPKEVLDELWDDSNIDWDTYRKELREKIERRRCNARKGERY